MAWFDQIKAKFVANVANMYLTENGFDVFNIFPKVNSRQISGYIAKYTKEDWLRIGTVNDYKRQGATESAGDDYTLGEQAYTLDEFAFHKDISKDDRNEYDNPFDPVRDAVTFVMNRINRILLYHMVSTFLTTGVWGTDSDQTSAQWDVKSSGVSTYDPVDAVISWKEAVEKTTGFTPNRMVISADAYHALQGNTKIMDRMKTTSDKSITKQVLARLFDVDQFMVMNAVNSAGDDYMWTSSCLLFYAPSVASKFNPSAGYNMLYKTGNMNVLTDRIPMRHLNNSLRIEAAVKIKPLVMATDLGVYGYNLNS